MPRRERLAQKQIHWDAKRLRTINAGAAGGTGPHALLGNIHNDTAVAAPVQGAMVLADDTPEWNILLHPAAAGYALVTDGTDVAWDQTPVWTGLHTFTATPAIELDVASGDPVIVFDTDGADKFTLGVDDSDSDIFKINSGAVLADPSDFELDSGGNVEIGGDFNLLTGKGIIHADGVAAGYVLRADGTRYVPADGAATLPVVPTGQGYILRSNAVPAWEEHLANTLGAALVGDGNDIVSDTTPDWQGLHTFSADLELAEFLHHTGDADTYIQFQDDRITLQAGGYTGIDIVEGASDYVVVNSTTIDSAFTAAFHVTDGNVGISRDGDPAVLHQFAYGVAGTDYPVIRGRFARTSRAAPSAAQDGDLLGRWGAGGYGATGFATVSTARIQAEAAENFTDAAMGTHLDFYTTPTGAVVAQERFRLTASGRGKFGGTAGASGQVDIEQSSATGATPVLRLEQKDVDREFIRVVGTAANGNLTRSLVDYGDEASSTAAVWIKVNVEDDGNQVTDQAYYILGYTLA
jgi:hypothetical protein